MFENEIDRLCEMREHYDAEASGANALDAAIALMRAACVPKDEAAERALAEKEALRLARELQYPDSYVHLAAAFVRLRAAVRAEMASELAKFRDVIERAAAWLESDNTDSVRASEAMGELEKVL